MKPLMEVINLTTRFHTQDGVVNAVNGISYPLEPGEILGIVGESGCGKSVHALSIMRLIQTPPGEIAAGEVWFDGRDLLKLPEKEMRSVRGREIAMVFQDPLSSLNPVYTVGCQISEALILHKHMSKKQAKERSIELLNLVGIPEPQKRFDAFPHQFSGGMRQRAMIAMALSCEPKLLIADEPTTALDVTIQAQILELILALVARHNLSLIFISHDLSVVRYLCDRVLVLHRGKAVESGATEELWAAPQAAYTRELLAAAPRLD